MKVRSSEDGSSVRMHVTKPTTERYGFAVVLSLAGIAIDLLLRIVLTESDIPVYTVLVGAVALAAWYGGLGPSILAIVLSWTLAFWLVVERGFFEIGSRSELIRWASALAVAVGLVVLMELTRRGRERAVLDVGAAEATIRDLESLQRLTAALSGAVSSSEVARVLTERASALLGAQGAALGLVDADELVVVDPSGLAARANIPGGRLRLDQATTITRAARDGSTVRVSDRATLVASFADSGVVLPPVTQGAIAAPVLAGGRVVGSIGFLFEREGAADEKAEALAVIVADLAGQALERARLYEQERESRQALDRILRVAPRFHADTAEEVTLAICREARTTFGADLATLWRLSDHRMVLVRSDPAAEPLHTGLQASLEDFPRLMDAVERLQVSFVGDIQETSFGQGLERVRQLQIHSSLRTPIAIAGRAELVLITSWRSVVSEPDPSTLVLVRRFADQAGLALEQLERNRALAEAALRADETRRLQTITAALSLASTAADVSNTCLESALEAVGAEAGFVVLSRADGTQLELVTSRGYSEAELETWRGFGADDDVPASLAISSGEPVWALLTHEMAPFVPVRDLGDAGWVALPLKTTAGVRGALHLSFRKSRELSDRERTWLQTVVSQCAQALERSRLFDEEQRMRTQSERLQSMTAALSNALTRADVAEVAVGEIGEAVGATGTALAVVVEDRQLVRTLAWRGYPDEVVEPWRELPLDAPSPSTRALGGRTSWYYGSLDEVCRLFPRAADELAATRHASFFFVPLVAGRRVSGVLRLSWDEERDVSREERRFVESLAAQAAQALDRASHFESEQTIAETLQRSVLPASLPRVEGVQLAARYLPGTAELDVGGDWFDAITLAQGRLGLVVGDVVGKGVQAAATMAQLRNALRAFALDRMKPASTLARLNRLADEVLETAFATIAYVVVDPEAGVCRYTSAGHPPPLVAYPDGTVELLEGGRGLPLGTMPDVRYTQGVAQLPAGSVLLLYTDGLVERRSRSLDEGLERLREAALEGPRDPELLVEHVLERMVGTGERGDDIALLAVRLLAVAPRLLELRVPSDVSSLNLVRDGLRVWLEGSPLNRTESEDVVLASWEACANAIEHARDPGGDHVTLRAELGDSVVRIVVEDTGQWAPPADRFDRGLGLRLMHSLMSSVEISPSDAGTRVTLEKETTTAGAHAP